jgi:Xaa-Pro aminopeptidase
MYAEHRRSFLEQLSATGSAAVIPTHRSMVRNHDCDFRFRPSSDFWYLTGFAEPEACLVLLPDLEGDGPGRSLLYLRELDKAMEIWNGRRLGLDAAPEALGVDEARNIESLWQDLPEILTGYEEVVFGAGFDVERDRKMGEVLSAVRRKARGGVRPLTRMVDHSPALHELRLFKSEAELDLVRKACAITTEAHAAAMAATAPGMNECEIDALVEYTFKRRGSTGAAYNNIVAGGGNACILHYVENNAELRDGDLLLIDAGAEWNYYASDVTRTFPINGRFNDEQRALYEVVLKAQTKAIEHSGPGVSFVSMHEVALQHLVQGLIELGLVSGSAEEVIEEHSYMDFFPHRTGHWMGLDVHDCGYYASDGSSRILEPGMVFTVEPGLYVDPDNQDVDERWRGIGVRIEDDVLVTSDGHEVLTAAIPKSLEEVQAACGAQAAEPVA